MIEANRNIFKPLEDGGILKLESHAEAVDVNAGGDGPARKKKRISKYKLTKFRLPNVDGPNKEKRLKMAATLSEYGVSEEAYEATFVDGL